MDFDQTVFDLIMKRLDEIKDTNDKQWVLIRKQEEYWSIAFFLGKLIAMASAALLAAWGVFSGLYQKP